MLGKCPFCDDGNIIVKETILNGKKGKLFQCSNAKYIYDNDIWVLDENSKCGYTIFSNCLNRYLKKHLGKNEIKKMLENGSVEVILHSRNPYFENGKKIYKEYKKYIIPNKEYGIEILWE